MITLFYILNVEHFDSLGPKSIKMYYFKGKKSLFLETNGHDYTPIN